MKLKGKLNSNYKSFTAGFEFEFDGPMAVLSGTNGSGKSQLFDIIRRLTQPKDKPQIASDLFLDDQVVGVDQVSFRSFKEGIHEFKSADPELIKASKEQIQNHYKGSRLHPRNDNLWHHRRCAFQAKEILIEVFGNEKFDKGQITPDEILSCSSLNGLIWKRDNIFENVVSEVFYKYAVKKMRVEREAGKSGEQLSYKSLGKAPWTKLNDLFGRFNFGYRFCQTYEIADNSFSLSEKPQLHHLDQDGMLIEAHTRRLNDLSDGERAIMSLALSSLSGEFAANTKLILLDEFDATLNPSLIKILYGVLDEYFIQKSIMVILVTHSSSTISMAPDGTNFYEVYNPLMLPQRILRVHRDDYSELRVAHERLYGDLTDQRERIRKLNEEKHRLEEILDGHGSPMVLVEGPTDISYIEKAAEFLQRKETLAKLDLQIVGMDSNAGTKRSNNKAMNAAGDFLKSKTELLARKVLILHDPEQSAGPENVGNMLFVRKMEHHVDAVIRNGIEGLFPPSVIDRAREHNPDWFKCEMQGANVTKLWIVGKKTDVCSWICENSTKDDFSHFAHIFDCFDIIGVSGAALPPSA